MQVASIFALLALLGAFGVVLLPSPVHAVMALVWTFIQSGIFVLLLGAEFLAFLLFIVYVGAVAILFLFVVMMLNVQMQQRRVPLSAMMLLMLFVTGAFFLGLFSTGQQDPWAALYEIFVGDAVQSAAVQGPAFSLKELGLYFYNEASVLLLLVGMLLLLSMVGAVYVVYQERKSWYKNQDMLEQLIVDPEDRLTLHEDVYSRKD